MLADTREGTVYPPSSSGYPRSGSCRGPGRRLVSQIVLQHFHLNALAIPRDLFGVIDGDWIWSLQKEYSEWPGFVMVWARVSEKYASSLPCRLEAV